MKGKARLLMVLAALSPLCLQAQGIADIIKALRTAQSYTARATFTVTLPSRDDDVTYRLSLAGTPSPADTLSPCSYLLQWELDTPSGPSRGWSSYFNGNLYAYRDHRIREYHTSWDPSPFASAKGSRTTGVQRTTQFVSLLPHYLADELTAMSADTLHTICPPQPASCDGTDAIRIDTRMTVNSETVQEKSYWFDSATLLPLRIDTESNPGSITEQSISVRYTPTATPAEVPQTEETLISLFPEHFEKYRESNFSIENLRGTPLPHIRPPHSHRRTLHPSSRRTLPRPHSHSASRPLHLLQPAHSQRPAHRHRQLTHSGRHHLGSHRHRHRRRRKHSPRTASRRTPPHQLLKPRARLRSSLTPGNTHSRHLRHRPESDPRLHRRPPHPRPAIHSPPHPNRLTSRQTKPPLPLPPDNRRAGAYPRRHPTLFIVPLLPSPQDHPYISAPHPSYRMP